MTNSHPDNTDSRPMPAAQQQVGPIVIRFVGLLALAIAVLALIYSR